MEQLAGKAELVNQLVEELRSALAGLDRKISVVLVDCYEVEQQTCKVRVFVDDGWYGRHQSLDIVREFDVDAGSEEQVFAAVKAAADVFASTGAFDTVANDALDVRYHGLDTRNERLWHKPDSEPPAPTGDTWTKHTQTTYRACKKDLLTLGASGRKIKSFTIWTEATYDDGNFLRVCFFLDGDEEFGEREGHGLWLELDGSAIDQHEPDDDDGPDEGAIFDQLIADGVFEPLADGPIRLFAQSSECEPDLLRTVGSDASSIFAQPAFEVRVPSRVTHEAEAWWWAQPKSQDDVCLDLDIRFDHADATRLGTSLSGQVATRKRRSPVARRCQTGPSLTMAKSSAIDFAKSSTRSG